MKVCKICGVNESLVRFRKYRSWCILCYADSRKEYNEKWYKDNKERHMAWTKNKRRDKKFRDHENMLRRRRYQIQHGWVMV